MKNHAMMGLVALNLALTLRLWSSPNPQGSQPDLGNLYLILLM